MAQQAQPVQQGLAAHVRAHPVPQEQLRFAVVLNGGVSLAVWMGGVVLELDRLTKSSRESDDVYALMQRLTGCRSRADVISGTSAGGINGAALALTQVNKDADPALLRDLWTDQGRIESLLRPPFRGQPTSLLQGDEYFLPRLHAAMEILADPIQGHRGADSSPIDLTITTTVLRGNQTVTVDSMGQQLPQSLHAGRFRWQRYDGDPDDPFSQREIRRTAHRLALASRASASFPFAFEPAFIPVGSPDHRDPGRGEPMTDEVRLRPDMEHHVDAWGDAGPRNRSRYAIDGGALANTPTQSALEAIERMPAKGPVRRVMLLVFPHAPEIGPDPADSQADPPTAAGALTGFLGALTAQGSRTYVEALERHNLLAAGRRGTRSDILEVVRPGPSAPTLASLSLGLYPSYRQLRRRRAARDLAAWRTGALPDGEAVLRDLPAEWNFERVREAAEVAQREWGSLPYVPDQHPTGDVGAPGWAWGVSGAVALTEAVSDLLRRMVWVMEQCAEYTAVTASRRKVLLEAQELRRSRDLTDSCWRSEPALTRLPPDRSYWQLRLACYDHLMLGRVGTDEIRERIRDFVATHPSLVEESDADTVVSRITAALGGVLRARPRSVGIVVRRHVGHVLDELATALAALDTRLPQIADPGGLLADWLRELTEPDPAGGRQVPARPELLRRLIDLEIANTTLGDEVTTGASMPIELVQVSAQAEVPFARHTLSGDDKLGGMSMARFGGFLKRSWRVNDWMWGRVDGATVLSKTVLQPQRMRRTAALSGYLDAHAAAGPTAMAAATLTEVLEVLTPLGLSVTREQQDRLVRELRPVFDPGCSEGDLPSALPELAAVFATALHLESVPSELPALARAIRADRVDGANPRSRGEVLLAEHGDLIGRLDAAAGVPGGVTAKDRLDSLEVFDRAGIGREPLSEEASSDLMIRTGSTAAAVITTVVDSGRSGLAAIKPVTRVLRGAMLLPYWIITGLTSRQGIARALALLGLAVGAVLLALSLFSVLPETLSGPAAALGAGVVLGAFGYAALRTGSLLHGVVLLTPLIPLVVFAVEGSGALGRNDEAGVQGAATLVAVVALTLALMLLGSISYATRSVWATLDAAADRRLGSRPGSATGLFARRLAMVVWWVLSVVGAVALVALLVAGVWWLMAPERIEDVRAAPAWAWLAPVALVVAAGAVAHVTGRRLQVLIVGRTGEEPRFAPVSHPHATAAGWAVVYAAVFLAAAGVLTLELTEGPVPLWQRVGFATAVTAAVLLLLAPLVLPALELSAMVRRETALRIGAPPRPPSPPPPAGGPSEQRRRRDGYAAELVARGVSYRTFVQATEPPRSCSTSRAWEVSLRPRGERLEQRIHDAQAAAVLRSRWQAPARPDGDDLDTLRDVLAAWREGPGRSISVEACADLDALQAALGAEPPDVAEVCRRHARLLRTLERRRRRTSPAETPTPA